MTAPSLTLHACGIETAPRECLVATGRSGSGKSTLAAAALACGLRVLSDDLLVGSLTEEGRPLIRPGRDIMVLRSGSRRLLPEELLRSLVAYRTKKEKKWALRRCDEPRRFVFDGCFPRLLIEVSVDRRRRGTIVTRLNQGQALAAVLTVSSAACLLQPDRAADEQNIEVATRLAARVSGVRMVLGTDLLLSPSSVVSALLRLTSTLGREPLEEGWIRLTEWARREDSDGTRRLGQWQSAAERSGGLRRSGS